MAEKDEETLDGVVGALREASEDVDAKRKALAAAVKAKAAAADAVRDAMQETSSDLQAIEIKFTGLDFSASS